DWCSFITWPRRAMLAACLDVEGEPRIHLGRVGNVDAERASETRRVALADRARILRLAEVDVKKCGIVRFIGALWIKYKVDTKGI
ncbi:MAG: hypothetical protein ACXU82_10920, partial [Caulobacteraceae bacterium]